VRDLDNGSVAASLDATGLVASALTGMAGPPAGQSGPAHPMGRSRAAGPPAGPMLGGAAGQSRRGRARRAGPPGGARAQLPYLIVLCGVIVGLALIWQGAHYVRPGTLTVAGALFVAATARLILPEQRAGLLASRRRSIDVTALAILAVGLLVAGLVLPIPW
jgi:Protein of unknown function (DUF3017)